MEVNNIITDLCDVNIIHTGNRFLLCILLPEQNISIWIVEGLAGANCVIAVGYSVINRTLTMLVGKTIAKFGGGNHKQAGTCKCRTRKPMR